MEIVNYHLKNINTDNFSKTTRTSIERNEHILERADEYLLQVKHFSVNIKIPLVKIDDNYQVGIKLTGGADSSIFFTPVSVSPQKIYSYNQLRDVLNIAFQNAFTNMKTQNPSYTSTASPILQNDDEGEFIFLVPTDLNTSPFSGEIFFSSALASLFNFGYKRETETIGSQSQIVYKLYTSNTDRLLDVGGVSFNTYYDYARKKGCSDLDAIVFIAHSIPVSGTLEHEQKRIESRIIKTINVSPRDILTGRFIFNKNTQDLYQLISYYPMSRVDVELFIRRKDGKLVPMTFYPNESFSCDIEFSRSN